MKRWARLEIYEWLAKWSLVVSRGGTLTERIASHSIHETARKARLLQMFVNNPTCTVKTVGPEVWLEIELECEE